MKNIMKAKKIPTYKKIHFWPNTKYNKMGSSYDDVMYTTTTNFHDFILENYFLSKDITTLPDNIQNNNFKKSNTDYIINISIDVNQYKEAYGEDFDWKNTNWFLSNFNSFAPTRIDRTYWKSIGNYSHYNESGEIIKVDFVLKLDEWSTFYDIFWGWKGVVEIEKLHNQRFVNDTIFGTDLKIPDFNENEFIRNCDKFCSQITQKTQYEKSQVLISNRNFDPETNTFISTLDTTFENNTLTKNVPYVIYVWGQSSVGEGQLPEENWTQIDNYAQPYKLWVVIPIGDDIAKEMSLLQKALKEKYKLIAASIGEMVIREEDLNEKMKEVNAYEVKKVAKTIHEKFLFQDSKDILRSMIFFETKNIIKERNVNWRNEPHIYTGNHTTLFINTYNKKEIMFDISNFLIKASNQSNIKYFSLSKSFEMIDRMVAIAPNHTIYNHILLDNDTSLAYKKNSSKLNHIVEGAYSFPIWEDSYNEFMKSQMIQKDAGLNMIETNNKIHENTGKWGLGQAITGAIGGVAGGAVTGGLLGPIGMGAGAALGAAKGIGDIFGGILGMGQKYEEAKAMAKSQRNNFLSKYEDAKSQPANINTGQPSNAITESNFSIFTDDENGGKFRKVFSPTLTIQQVKEYEAQNIALHVNKYGYEQKRTISIKHFNDLMKRKYWNVIQIANAMEFGNANGISNDLILEFLTTLSTEGVRFHNVETNPYEDLFDYEKHNYEKNFDESIMTLEGLIYG